MDEINLLAVASFVGVAVGGVAGFLGYYLRLGRSSEELKSQLEHSKNVMIALNNLEKNYLRILDEKADIVVKISSIGQQVRYQLSLNPPASVYQPKLFQQEPVVDYQKQKSYDIAYQLENLLKSYPEYDYEKRNDIDYLNEFNIKISEHHSRTEEIADLFFADKIEFLSTSSELSLESKV